MMNINSIIIIFKIFFCVEVRGENIQINTYFDNNFDYHQELKKKMKISISKL